MASKSRIVCIRVLHFKKNLEEETQKLAEACNRFTPKIGIRKNDLIFLEIDSYSRELNSKEGLKIEKAQRSTLDLFSERTLTERIFILAQRIGLSVKVSFADTLCVSLAKSYFSNFEKTENFSHLPLDALFCFLNPFETPCPSTKNEVEKLIQTLKALGIRDIEGFLQLSPHSLGSRFGKSAALIYSFAKRETDPVWKGYQPSPLIIEKMELGNEEIEGDFIHLDTLLFSLKSLLDRAFSRLIGLGKRASKIEIKLKMANWSTVRDPNRIWEISFPIAQGTSVGVIPILREYLSRDLERDPLLAPARSLQLKITSTVPGHGAQKDFFQTKEAEFENWDELLGRLISQLGEGYVFQAALKERYCPEQSWTRKMTDTSNQNFSSHGGYSIDRRELFSSNERPSRILKNPELLNIKPSLLILQNWKFWKIQKWQGPERITSEWWTHAGSGEIHRDYYHVITQNQEKLWVFFDRTQHPPQAFLHGFFD